MNWQNQLMRLVKANRTELFPLATFNAAPAAAQGFPDNLPSSHSIRQFYDLCDGGYMAGFKLFGVSEIVDRNAFWIQQLREYYPDKSSPLSEKHLVIGEDDAGAPLIWDSETDAVGTFWFKGGDWEPASDSLDAFLQNLLVDYEPQNGGDLWFEAVQQLKDTQSGGR